MSSRAGRLLLRATVAFAPVLAGACGDPTEGREQAEMATGGRIDRGALAIRHYGCGACHTIDGIPGANGRVGPPLTGLIMRAYIGGVVPNAPDNLIRWIQNPKSLSPQTAMPYLGVTERDARDIAAYLYTLQED